MRIRSFPGRLSARFSSAVCISACIILLAASTSLSAASQEVAAEYKAKGKSGLNLVAYEDELLDCSALAAIHMWIGDDLGDDPGAEVRKKINSNYWIDVSKSYLALAEKAAGKKDLSKDLGVRMRTLSAQFRDLTETHASPDKWGEWYNLVDRCDSWRPDRPRHAFYDNGRQTVADVDGSAKMSLASG